jgi:hypothetical protein
MKVDMGFPFPLYRTTCPWKNKAGGFGLPLQLECMDGWWFGG